MAKITDFVQNLNSEANNPFGFDLNNIDLKNGDIVFVSPIQFDGVVTADASSPLDHMGMIRIVEGEARIIHSDGDVHEMTVDDFVKNYTAESVLSKNIIDDDYTHDRFENINDVDRAFTIKRIEGLTDEQRQNIVDRAAEALTTYKKEDLEADTALKELYMNHPLNPYKGYVDSSTGEVLKDELPSLYDYEYNMYDQSGDDIISPEGIPAVMYCNEFVKWAYEEATGVKIGEYINRNHLHDDEYFRNGSVWDHIDDDIAPTMDPSQLAEDPNLSTVFTNHQEFAFLGHGPKVDLIESEPSLFKFGTDFDDKFDLSETPDSEITGGYIENLFTPKVHHAIINGGDGSDSYYAFLTVDESGNSFNGTDTHIYLGTQAGNKDKIVFVLNDDNDVSSPEVQQALLEQILIRTTAITGKGIVKDPDTGERTLSPDGSDVVTAYEIDLKVRDESTGDVILDFGKITVHSKDLFAELSADQIQFVNYSQAAAELNIPEGESTIRRIPDTSERISAESDEAVSAAELREAASDYLARYKDLGAFGSSDPNDIYARTEEGKLDAKGGNFFHNGDDINIKALLDHYVNSGQHEGREGFGLEKFIDEADNVELIGMAEQIDADLLI